METTVSAFITLDKNELEEAVRNYLLKKRRVKCSDIRFTDGGADHESVNVNAVRITVHEDDVNKIFLNPQ